MMSEPEEKREKRHKLIEDIFILLCIASLWPVVLGWTEPIYQYLLYVALAGLIFIFVRRIRRFHDARNALRDAETDPQIGPAPKRDEDDLSQN